MLVPAIAGVALLALFVRHALRADEPEHRFWTGVRRIVADGPHVEIEWFEPIAPRPIEVGGTTVECHLFADDALAEAERRRAEVVAVGP